MQKFYWLTIIIWQKQTLEFLQIINSCCYYSLFLAQFRFYIMKGTLHFLSLRKNFDAFLFALAAWGVVFLFTRHGGIGLSPDSVSYLAAAKNFYEKGSLTVFCNAPLCYFPAFYPVFLSGIIFITKQSPVAFGTMLNGFFFGAVIYLSGCMLQRFINFSRLYKNIILLCILCSASLIEVYYMLWSETLFIFLLLVFFIAIHRYFYSLTLSSLLLAAFIAALACVTRYTGVTLIGTGCLLIVFDKFTNWKKKLLHGIVFIAASLSLLSVNLIYNYMRTGFLTGNRQRGTLPLIKNVETVGSVAGSWLPFFNSAPAIAKALAIIAFALACFCFVKHIFKKIYYYSYENIALSFFIVYIFFIVVSSTLSFFGTLDNRLLSPVYIPFLFGITYTFPLIIKKSKGFLKPAFLCGFLLLAFFFIRNQVLQSEDLYEDANENGIPGFSDDSWRYSSVINWLHQNNQILGSQYTMYTNSIEAMYLFTSGNYCWLPHQVNKEEVKQFLNKDSYYIIWFTTNIDNWGTITPDFIEQNTKLTLVKSLPDGNIYWCDKQ